MPSKYRAISNKAVLDVDMASLLSHRVRGAIKGSHQASFDRKTVSSGDSQRSRRKGDELRVVSRRTSGAISELRLHPSTTYGLGAEFFADSAKPL